MGQSGRSYRSAARALTQQRHPVAIDNDYANWNRFENRYWPAFYLRDRKDLIRTCCLKNVGASVLEEQVVRFLSDRSRNRYDAVTHTLEVSETFDWYREVSQAVSKGSGTENSLSPSTRSC